MAAPWPERGQPPVYLAILSAPDRSVASADGDVLYLQSNAPTYPSNGWDVNKDGHSLA